MEAELEQRLNKNQPRQNLEQKYKNEEHTKWEENQLINSGIFKAAIADGNMEENEENRVVLMIHDLKPPFLDGNTQFSTQIETIQVVKDPNSDMALLSKKGSAVVKELRERNERSRVAKKEEKSNERLKQLFDKNEKEGAELKKQG